MDIVQALEKLTLRNDIIYMTLNPLKLLLNNRNVMQNFRRWCPCCFNEWKTSGDIIYEPLIWQIDSVTYCPIHRCKLENQCLNCKKELRILNNSIQNGFCQYCGSWLGEKESKFINVDDITRTITENYCELLAANYEGVQNLTKDGLHFTLMEMKKTLGYTNTALANLFNTGYQQVSKWIKGRTLPNINAYLAFACSTQTSSFRVFVEGNFSTLIQSSAEREKIFNIRSEKSKYGLDLTTLENMLLDNLLKKQPLLLIEIERKYNICRKTIRGHFPDLFRRHIELNNKKQVNESLDIYLEMLKDPTISVNQICKGNSTEYRFLVREIPELVARQVSIRNERLELKRREIEGFLEKILEEESHLDYSLKSLANEYGYSRSYIYKQFPQLCAEISRRYKQVQKEKREKEMEKVLCRIKETAIKLHKDNQYPSTNKIIKEMNCSGLFLEAEFRLFHKKLIKDLGY